MMVCLRWLRRKKSKAPEQPTQQALPSSAQNDEKLAAENIALPPRPPAQVNEPEAIPPRAAESAVSHPTQEKTAPINISALETPFGSISPFGLDPRENDETIAVWAQVQEKVASLATMQQRPVNTGLQIDDVLQNLEASQEKEGESPKKQAVKVTFERTMGLIKTVGGMVGDGASAVFAPAGHCYNAISFLINAYEGYQGAFDSLAELLEKCSDHLGRLDYYAKGGMDKRLSKLAAQQLLLLVRICDAAMNLRDSIVEKIKTGLKIAFLAENSIQALLGEMDKLAEKEFRLVTAQTFSLTSGAATSSRQVLDKFTRNEREQKVMVKSMSRRLTLIDVLAFDEKSEQWNSSKQAPVETWRMRYNEIREEVVPGTGEWLFSHSDFQSWISDFSSFPILAVEGTDITGKSYLTSSVIKYLRTDVITQYPELRHLVSFFFLDEDNGYAFNDAAKSLIWQLANKDEPYMRSAARISQEVGVLDPKDIIPRLLLENTELERTNAVSYLVIDGVGDDLDSSMIKFLQRLCQTKNQRIRVFLTGTPRAFEQMRKIGVNCPSLNISRHNEDDVKKFIDARMDEIDALADTERPGISEQREKICKGHLQAASGDYYKLNSALYVISTLDYADDINQVIQGATDDRFMQLNHEIEMLNRELSPRQIQEMNNLIIWVTFSFDKNGITERLASSVLYMATGEVPLRALAEKIRTRYLLLELNARNRVVFRSSKALEAIPHRSELAKVSRNNGQEIHPGEIEIVLHFLDNVCPPALYQKLGLREYLQQKSTQKQDQIQQEDNDASHLQIALDCMRSFIFGHDASISELQKYALQNLGSHLRSVDLAMVDRGQKSRVGESLVAFFTQNQSLNALLFPDGNRNPYSNDIILSWLTMNSYMVAEVDRWLRDTAVVSSITDSSERSWVQSVLSDKTIKTLFTPMATRLAHRCLREQSFFGEPRAIYKFMREFLQRILNGFNDDEGESGRICKFEQWAHEALGFPEKDSLWHTQMAKLYAMTELPQEATERSKLALKLDPDNWGASLCLAMLVPADEAIELLQDVISHRENDMEWIQGPLHVKVLSELKYELAEKYYRASQLPAAIPHFAASFKYAFHHPRRILAALSMCYLEGLFAEIILLLEVILATEDVTYIGNLVMETRDWEFNKILDSVVSWAMFQTKQYGVLDKLYEAAIQNGSKTNDQETLGLVRYLYGKSISCSPRRNEDKAIELWEASLSDYIMVDGKDSAGGLLTALIQGLAPLYKQRACAARAASDSITEAKYVSKLRHMLPEGVTQSQLHYSPDIWLGGYYRLAGDHSKARKVVRSSIQVVIELLSDEDESNDADAFEKAYFVFVMLADDRNALTALAMKTHEGRLVTGEDKGYRITAVCDGDCGKDWTIPSEMWKCRQCADVDFDFDCMEKLKKGELQNICNPDHDFLEVPKWDAEWLDSIPKGMVPWGDQNITLDVWKQEIRKLYLE